MTRNLRILPIVPIVPIVRVARTLRVTVAILATAILTSAGPSLAMRAPELPPDEVVALKREFATSLAKLKGPYTENFCVCRGTNAKIPVRNARGVITSPCGNNPLFCSAFRATWGEALAKHRVWIANSFARDLWLWPQIADHHDLVRGFILEKYFVDNNPTHKLAQLKAFGGLSGSEFETGASTEFFEKYLSEPGFDDSRHFPLAYELQRRYFVRDDLGQVEKVRSMAVRIQASQPSFKPLRDAIHNQLSPGLIPLLAAYRDKQAAGGVRTQVDALLVELSKLTALDEGAMHTQLVEIADPALRGRFTAMVPAANADPVAAISALGHLMYETRRTIAARQVSVADARRLIDLDITTGAVLQRRGNKLIEGGSKLSVRQNLELMSALVDAGYGAGLLVEREHEAAKKTVDELLANNSPSREEFTAGLRQAGRIVEWAQANATLPYAEVWAQWTLLMPQVALVGDDVLRSSPLMLFAQVYGRLDDHAAGTGAKRHEIFGSEVTGGARVLNPGLAVGKLRVSPKDNMYSRNEVVALEETPAELQPAAGILTAGEGNVLSHVQLLARSLGIPNAVLGPEAFARTRPHDGQLVYYVATPGGRAVLKEFSKITPAEKAAWAEYSGNEKRSGEAGFASSAAKLHIDTEKIDLSKKLPIDLATIRRTDSGKICGPKGAFLGELKHLFPDKVSRGIVVPFGAYREHYDRALVSIPPSTPAGVATAGEHLPAFIERTYKEFFGTMMPSVRDPRELSEWIAPRLAVVRYSIQQTPLAPELQAAIRDGLDKLGLLRADARDRTVGCFVRSDTNVEDLDSFNGAGLNLTIFNMGSLDEIYSGLREVWASPFQLRSFSWRQTLIDEPLWVLPSVVILESVPSDKSGVLVTCDIETGDQTKMVIATSEGVGGAVDGTSAETLRWSPGGVDLLTLYKSAWKNALLPGGGSRVVPASGKDEVLSPKEVEEIVAAGKAVTQKLEPARDAAGRPRPWDIEFGFSQGKLWLFQSRPFIGNESVKNVPALAVLDSGTTTASAKDRLSLTATLQ